MGGRLVSHAFPPNATVQGESDVGEDGVFAKRDHRIRVGFVTCARSYAKKACFWIDGVKAAIRSRLKPRNVVSHGPDFPSFLSEMLGRNQHGKVGFATSGREGSGDIGLLAFWILDTQDQHVLSHPTFVAGHGGCDAQGETFFTQKCVAAVAGTIAPNFAGLGKVNDVFLCVAGPGHVFLAGFQWCSDRVHAGHHAFVGGIDDFKDGFPNARHDAHVHDGVGGVGQLNSNLRHGRPQGTHAIRQHIQGAALHAAVEKTAQFLLHFERVHPIVGGPGAVFGGTADVGAVFNTGHIAGIGASEETAGPFFFVEPGESTCCDHLFAEAVVFLLGAIDPMNPVGLAKSGHFLYPPKQVNVGAKRNGRIGGGHDVGGFEWLDTLLCAKLPVRRCVLPPQSWRLEEARCRLTFVTCFQSVWAVRQKGIRGSRSEVRRT